MYMKYGNYTHDSNLASFSINRENRYHPLSNAPVSQVYRVAIRGTLRDTTQAGLRTQINALDAAYAIQGQEWGLYHDDATLSAHYLPHSSTLMRPIRVVKPPSYDRSEAAEYATERTYSIELEAEYRSWEPNFIEFSESVTISGTGGPRYVVTELLLTLPVRDKVTNATLVKATQSGQAFGWQSRPYSIVPPPLWPQVEDVWARQITEISPEQQGPGLYRRYGIAWSYSFTSHLPLFGGTPLPQ